MWKRRVGWALWLLGAAILYIFENNAATLTLLAATVLIPPASVVTAMLSAKRISVELLLPAECPKDKWADCTLRLTGGMIGASIAGTLRCKNVLTGETTGAGLSAVIGIKRESITEFQIDAAHCGSLLITLDDFSARDLFGLWHGKPISCASGTVIVRPELFPARVTLVENTTVVSDGERYSMTHPGSDPSETFAVREYIPGDPVRQIHWKLSQKTDKLMIRELGLPMVDETLLLFETSFSPVYGEADADAIDTMAEAFLSVSRALITDGLAHTAGWKNSKNNQLEISEIRSERDFEEMTERFLCVGTAANDETVAENFGTWCERNVYAHVAVIAPGMPPGVEIFCYGNRVTVLAVGGAVSPIHHTYNIPLPVTSLEESLEYIEL